MREQAHDVGDPRVDPVKAAKMVGFHLAALLAPWCFSWEGLIVFYVLGVVIGQLGLAVGYHRLICHRSFRTPAPLHYLLVLFGVLALQGGPLTWTAIHRLHHRHPDSDEDPQATNRPAWQAYLFWTLDRHLPGLGTPQAVARVTSDLQGDRGMHVLENWQYALNAALALGLFFAGWSAGGWFPGLSLLVWGFFLRTVVGWHLALLVNLFGHRSGYRRYPTPDRSRNCWWLTLLTLGEGWHNNHHHQPRSAAHGHRWFEIDLPYLFIRGLEAVGLASGVVRPRRGVAARTGAPEVAAEPSSQPGRRTE